MRTSEHQDSGGLLDEHDWRPGRRRRRRWVGWFVVLVVLGGLVGGGLYAYRAVYGSVFSPSCTATASGSSVTFSPEQTANAALIAGVSHQRALPARAATIAIATSIQESKLLNITYGDRDSIGLFQQRPSQGWGTKEQILDPIYSTNAFYDALVKIDGYESMDITTVAQKVQRSAYPLAYADHEQEGRILASVLRGPSPAGLVCDLRPITQVVDAAAVGADLTAQTGVTPTQDGSVLTVAATSADQAWMVGQWAVARAEAYGIDRVQVGDRAWHRDAPGSWSSGESSPSATTVTIRLGAARG